MSIKPELYVVNESLKISDLKTLIDSGKPFAMLDVLITVDIARFLLQYNRSGETNRKLSRATVALNSRALLSGNWENTGEPIIISNAKLLNDGQHRLYAIVETGIPAIMDIRFGVERHAYAATNSGGKRTGADALVMTSTSNTVNVASVARMVLAYEAGLPAAARQRIANGSIVAAVERWPDISDAIKYASNLPKLLRNAAINTMAFFALRTANDASIREFFHVLETGEGKASNPPHMLREVLLRHRGGQDTGTRIYFLAIGIIAWNSWRKAPRRLERLDWKTSQPFPRVDGLVL